jgi:hypothetical protein
MAKQWQDAHVGIDSKNMTFRLTDEESKRLEELRSELRLTSKAQVLRAALDALQILGAGGMLLTGENWEQYRGRGDRLHEAIVNNEAIKQFIAEHKEKNK